MPYLENIESFLDLPSFCKVSRAPPEVFLHINEFLDRY